MIFCQLPGHRMAGSAHFVILWQENMGFGGKTGHRMTYTASIVILWHKNESGGGGTLRSRPWWDWKNCFSVRVELRNWRNGASETKEVFSRRRCGGLWGRPSSLRRGKLLGRKPTQPRRRRGYLQPEKRAPEEDRFFRLGYPNSTMRRRLVWPFLPISSYQAAISAVFLQNRRS